MFASATRYACRRHAVLRYTPNIFDIQRHAQEMPDDGVAFYDAYA